MMRAALALAAVASAAGHAQDAYIRPQLLANMSLMSYVEKDEIHEEVHVTGEYTLVAKGDDHFSSVYGGITHRIILCDPCYRDSFFRIAVAPSKEYSLQLYLVDGKRNRLQSSEKGGQAAEKMLARSLEKGSSYFIDVVYDPTESIVTCFMELSLLGLKEPQYYDFDVPAPDPEVGLSQADGASASMVYESPRFPDSPLIMEAEDNGFDGFFVAPPTLADHDGQWRLRVDLSADFLTGGDITAVLSDKLEGVPPSLEECGDRTVHCVFGVRGKWANTYTLDVGVFSGKKYKVWLIRRAACDEPADGVDPGARRSVYWFKASLRAETLDETELSCTAFPLPESLNVPGFYSPVSGEMAVDLPVLIESDRTMQSSTITAIADSLLRMTLNHPDIDVGIELRDASKKVVATSASLNAPEGITFLLQANQTYTLIIHHSFEYVEYDEGWLAPCNAAQMRLEVTKVPLPYTDDLLSAASGVPNASVIPDSLSDDFSFAAQGMPYKFDLTRPTQELIQAWEFHVAVFDMTLRAAVPQYFSFGDVVMQLVPLSFQCVQLTQVIWEDDTGTKVTQETFPDARVSNPGGDNPDEEGPENVLSPYQDTKWLSGAPETPLIFSFKEPVLLKQLTFVTGNDYDARDPVQWRAYACDDTEWTSGHPGPTCDLILNQNTNYNTTTSRRASVGPFSLNTTNARLVYILFVTKTRDYNSALDVTWSESDLDSSFLSRSLTSGRYRLSLLTGFGTLYDERVADAKFMPRAVLFGLSVQFSTAGACTAKMLPSALGTVERRTYVDGVYQIPPSGEHVMMFTTKKEDPPVVNLNIPASDVPLEKVELVLNGADDMIITSDDYYNKGLAWFTYKVKWNETGADFKIVFTFVNDSIGSCDVFSLRLALSTQPSSATVTTDVPEITTLDIMQGAASLQLPYDLSETYYYGADPSDHKHHNFYVDEAFTIRALVSFDFAFLHIYFDMCICTGPSYEIETPARDCYHGDSIFNGNHFPPSTFPKGYYAIKIYETSFSEDKANRVSYFNEVRVAINIHPAVLQAPNQTMCGHQPLPATFTGPGRLTSFSPVPWAFHSTAEYLVPRKAGNKRSVATTFRVVGEASLLRIWVPSQVGLSVGLKLLKLLPNGNPDFFWPDGSPGIEKSDGEAIYRVIDAATYKLKLDFTTEDSDECLTFNFEMSVLPSTELVDITQTTCIGDSVLPTDMHATYSELYRRVPNMKNSKDAASSSFLHAIPFDVATVQGGRVFVDLYSDFAVGGLTMQIRERNAGDVVIYPVRYMSRDVIQHDLSGPGKYELIIMDMASQEDNLAVQKDLGGNKGGCNRFQLAIQFEDFEGTAFESCSKYLINPPTSFADEVTEQRFMYYQDLVVPEDPQLYTFSVGDRTIFKTWTTSVTGGEITMMLWGTGRKLVANTPRGHTVLIDEVLDAGSYTLEVKFPVTLGSVKCGGEEYSLYDMAVGVQQLDAVESFCEDRTWGDAPAKQSITGTACEFMNFYRLEPSEKGKRNKYVHEITVTVEPERHLQGGTLHVFVKFNWLVANLKMTVTTTDGTVHEAPMLVDPNAELDFTSELALHETIAKEGEYVVRMEGYTEPSIACLPFYLAVQAIPGDDAENDAEIALIDPLRTIGIVPTRPFEITMFLSKPVAPSSLQDNVIAYMRDDSADGTGTHVQAVTTLTSPTTLLLSFELAYGKSYSLVITAKKMVSLDGDEFSSSIIDKRVKDLLYKTVGCRCRDLEHCEYGSPCECLEQGMCYTCPDDAKLMGNVCVRAPKVSAAPVTFAPTPVPPDVPPTQPPATSMPADVTLAPKTSGPDTQEEDGAGSSSSTAILVVLVVVAASAVGVLYAHKQGFIEVPCMAKPPAGSQRLRLADESLFDDDDDDDDDDDGSDVSPGPAARPAGADATEVEMQQQPADDQVLRRAPPEAAPVAPSQPAPSSSQQDADDELFGFDFEPNQP